MSEQRIYVHMHISQGCAVFYRNYPDGIPNRPIVSNRATVVTTLYYCRHRADVETIWNANWVLNKFKTLQFLYTKIRRDIKIPAILRPTLDNTYV